MCVCVCVCVLSCYCAYHRAVERVCYCARKGIACFFLRWPFLSEAASECRADFFIVVLGCVKALPASSALLVSMLLPLQYSDLIKHQYFIDMIPGSW